MQSEHLTIEKLLGASFLQDFVQTYLFDHTTLDISNVQFVSSINAL